MELRELRRVTVLGGSGPTPLGRPPAAPGAISPESISCLPGVLPSPARMPGPEAGVLQGCYSEGGDGDGRVRLSGGSSVSVGSRPAPAVWGGLRVSCCIQPATVLPRRGWLPFISPLHLFEEIKRVLAC